MSIFSTPPAPSDGPPPVPAPTEPPADLPAPPVPSVDPDPSTLFVEAHAVPPPRAPTDPARKLLVVGAAVAIVLGFAAGFALAGARSRSSRGGEQAASVTTTTAAVTIAPTIEEPSTTEAPSTEPATSETTTTAATSTTSAVSTTLAPTTAAPSTTQRQVVTTTSVVVAPPSTFAPPHIQVTYPADAAGRLVIPRGGSATFTISNTGGLASQWLVSGTGFSTGGSATRGTLGPGQSTSVTVGPPPGELPNGDLTGSIDVLGAVNPTIPFVIH